MSISAIRGQKQQATIVPFIVIPHKPIHRKVKIRVSQTLTQIELFLKHLQNFSLFIFTKNNNVYNIFCNFAFQTLNIHRPDATLYHHPHI